METTWAHRLREVGLRVTRPRLSVLDVLSAHPHADADTLVTGARAQHPTLSPQTVYGVLDALVSRGLARRMPLTKSTTGRVISRNGDSTTVSGTGMS